MSDSHNLDFGRAASGGAGHCEPITELNLEICEAYVATATDLQERWRALNAPARLRLASCPFLLVDAGFAQPHLWARQTHAVCDALPVRTLLANRSPLPTPLVRRVLLLGWHMARTNLGNARLALGMSRSCAAAVAGWRLADLEALAVHRPGWIRPRWEQQSGLWRAWLAAAARESPRTLERLQLWGLQALAAEVRRQSA
jgi:hypothetical protein